MLGHSARGSLLLGALLLVACGDDGGPVSRFPDTGCAADSECPADAPYCRMAACHVCGEDDHCGADQICVDFNCVSDTTDTCAVDSDCPRATPDCLILGSGEGVCVGPCIDAGDCGTGAGCVEATCVACAAVPGAALPGEDCACDADCAGLGATCVEGTCDGDCQLTGCPAGLECTGTPPSCVVCEPDDRPEGSGCSCDAECGDLSCIGGLCGESCAFDETCGARECRHEILVAPSCQDPSTSCVGNGAGELGDDCICNRDCGFDAPFCTGYFADGARGSICSDTCGAEIPCPDGFACCGVDGELHCMTTELADATGARCL